MNKNNQAPVKGSCSSYKISEILKFLVPSLIGVTLFMLPVSPVSYTHLRAHET